MTSLTATTTSTSTALATTTSTTWTTTTTSTTNASTTQVMTYHAEQSAYYTPRANDDHYGEDPVSLDIMEDPIICCLNGHTGERAIIESIIAKAEKEGVHPRCPVGREVISRAFLVSNLFAKESIAREAKMKEKEVVREAELHKLKNSDIGVIQNLLMKQTEVLAQQTANIGQLQGQLQSMSYDNRFFRSQMQALDRSNQMLQQQNNVLIDQGRNAEFRINNLTFQVNSLQGQVNTLIVETQLANQKATATWNVLEGVARTQVINSQKLDNVLQMAWYEKFGVAFGCVALQDIANRNININEQSMKQDLQNMVEQERAKLMIESNQKDDLDFLS